MATKTGHGKTISALLCLVFTASLLNSAAAVAAPWKEPAIPGTTSSAVTLGRDLDGDGDPDEVHIRLEVIEVQEEVYPGKFVTFWVFAPEGRGMVSPARLPSPTIRVEQGDRVKITLLNTHYFPHTIHLHGTIHPNRMDGVPVITQPAVKPGESFTYEFIAKNPGTHFYHCHVQPDVHVLMGLVGMLIIEPNRPRNNFRHLIPGAGRIKDLAKGAAGKYEREYSMVYMEIDDRLNRIAEYYKDPREIEMRMHREYDSTRRQPNIFMLNGRSFPFTLRDTPIDVKAGERSRLRVLNAGARTINLHTHGHHPTQTHLDGYALPAGLRVTRDVFTIGAAQRVDLLLRTGSDDRYASGPGVWIMHDHTEHTVTNDGISPGGDITTIVYQGFKTKDGLPRVATSLKKFFDPNYYRGNVPVFDPRIFHSTKEGYTYGWPETGAKGDKPVYPVRRTTAAIQKRKDPLEGHTIAATSCKRPRGVRRIKIRGGAKFAREGEVFGFEPRVIRVKRCEEIEFILENTDSVRHALMIPRLNPMFILEFAGPGTRVARFVAPDDDITLAFHCHVPTHEKMGMRGLIIVGKGGRPKAAAATTTGKLEKLRLFVGVGIVKSADVRGGRLIVDHEEIKDFMAPMVMNYLVKPASLLRGLKSGQKIRFTIDADKRAIVAIKFLN